MVQVIGNWFQASGFGCQGTELLNPDTRNLTPETFCKLQHVVK
ncbi:hypothetical protein D1AOALGA4SA_8940 [Olavius algarvensis Delta 1 endosymbiont]|nr:hypothetical protein D1AOALGA4SA_8940 [Olavius algarvensis Delta 1 endosymbiont]